MMLQVPTMPVDELPPLLDATMATLLTAHSSSPPPPRTTRTVLQDLFHTYTGCDSIEGFLSLQREGAHLGSSLREGAGLPIAAVQPRVQPALEQWYNAITAKQPVTVGGTTDSTGEVTRKGAYALRASRGSSIAAAHKAAPASRASTTTAVADSSATCRVLTASSNSDAFRADGDEEEEEDEDMSATLLPPLEELPPITRCDVAAVQSLRQRVQSYLARLYELVRVTKALSDRWGRLTTSERTRLKEAIHAEKRARVTEKDLLLTIRELNFSGERLTALLATDMLMCSNVCVLRCSDNPALTELGALPAACHTVVACACSLERVSVFSASVTVMGLSFNNLRTLAFMQHFPSLKVLDVRANCLTSLEEAIADINAHGEIGEISLAGNPMALLDRYRSRLASSCPRIDKLDGRLLLAEERGLEGTGSAAGLVLVPATAGKGVAHINARNGRKRRSLAPAGGRPLSSEHGRPSSKHEAEALAAQAAASAAEAARVAEERIACTVGAEAELLEVRGLSRLKHTAITVNPTEDFRRNAGFLCRAMGSPTGKTVAGVPAPPLDPQAAAASLSAGISQVPQPPSTRGATGNVGRRGNSAKVNDRKGPASSTGHTSGAAATSSQAASTTAASHQKGRPGSRGGAAPAKEAAPLYEYASTLVLHGVWGEGGQEEEGDDAVAIATAPIPLGASSNFMPSVTTAAHALVTPVPGAKARSLSLAHPSATAAAAAIGLPALPPKDGEKADGVFRPSPTDKAHRLFTGPDRGLALTPSLGHRLRRPFLLHVEVHDEVCFPDEHSLITMLDGAAGESPASVATPQAPTASATAAAGAGHRHTSSAQKRLSMALASAQQQEQQRQRTETFVYKLGTILVDPQDLLLRPPTAVPLTALLALREQQQQQQQMTAEAVPGRESSASTRPLDPSLAYQRELLLTGCRLERSAADERSAQLRLSAARASLREAVTSWEQALAEVAEEARGLAEQSSATVEGSTGTSVNTTPRKGCNTTAAKGNTGGTTSAAAGAAGAASSTLSGTSHRRASLRPPANAALQRCQAGAATRHARVVALATKVAVLERRLRELYGGSPSSSSTPAASGKEREEEEEVIAVNLRLAVGRGPMTPEAAAAAALRNAAPGQPTRGKKTG